MTLNIQDMIAELSAGQEARQRIPELEKALIESDSRASKLADHNMALELRAKDRDETISYLNTKIVDLSKERDDAQFRVMEVEDTLKSFRQTIMGLRTTIGIAVDSISKADAALDPPKPEPIAQPTQETVSVPKFDPSMDHAGTTQGPSELPPLAAPSTVNPPPIVSTTNAEPSANVSTALSRETETLYTPEPNNNFERDRRARGLDWWDTAGTQHNIDSNRTPF